MSIPPEPRPRGRPRSSSRTTAILDAAVELIHEVGWDGFRVQDVAERANAGLATIYRRWPTKEHLIADAIRQDALFDPPATDDPRAALRALVVDSVDRLLDSGTGFITVVAASFVHPPIASAVQEVLAVESRNVLRPLIASILDPEHPLLPTLVDTILSLVILRGNGFGEAVSGAAVADEVIALLDTVSDATRR